MTKPKIEQVDIADLKLTPRNPRKRTPESASVINKSLKEFGACRSIVIDENRIIRAGNGTITEARELGMEDVLIVEATGDQIVAVQRKGLTEEQWERYTFVDNYASDASTYDIDILREISQEVDLESFCFPGKLEDLFKELEGRTSELAESQETEGGGGGESTPHEKKEEDQEAVEKLLDNVEEVEPRVKPGEVWSLGRHRLGCGDSTVEGNLRALLGDRFGQIGMIFTDPPYNVAYEGKTEEKLVIENDSFASSSDFYTFLLKYYSSCCNAAKPGAAIYVCHADTEGENFRRGMRERGWLYKQSIVWVKQSLVLGRQDYHWKHEPILYGWKPGAAHNWYADRSQTTVWNFNRPTASREHPTMKPLDLIEYALGNSSAPTDLIYDGFLGSGSTLMAAQKMEGDRTVYGFELSPQYCTVILDRFKAFSGIEPKLIGRLD
jgi:DNA modification methylase/ParB-like chromosome segregation protein Spo0J